MWTPDPIASWRSTRVSSGPHFFGKDGELAPERLSGTVTLIGNLQAK